MESMGNLTMKKKFVLITLLSFCLVACGSNEKSTSKSINKYWITFNDETGKLLDKKEWDEFSTPSYNYQKQDTAEFDYTFKGWSESLGGSVINIPVVTKDATYYAVVDSKIQNYTLSFVSNGGSNVNSINADYGTQINEPAEPTRDGYAFVSWCLDDSLNNAVTWPLVLTSNTTLYAKWNEKTNILEYISSLLEALNQDPFSYIPLTMQPNYAPNLVKELDVAYDFTNFTAVNSIKYGGFGEQWEMVIDNIQQSENFYSVLTFADNIISASVIAFNNWFDKNPSSTNKEINETGYYAKVVFSNNVLTYTLRVKTGFSIPFFGQVIPQIDMQYDIKTGIKSVRINLTDSNAMRYIVSPNQYIFGIKYGMSDVNREAYCQLTKGNNGSVEGHIYEYIATLGVDAIKSCADFYIDENYVSVVGNKASGMTLFDGYINELYKTNTGKLLGYKVMETLLGVTYHTLWFNLCDISGIDSVKVTDHTKDNDNDKNNNNIYINGSESLFKPTFNYQALVIKTSRKYDIELRKSYRYGMKNNKLSLFETNIPMMFIQDNHDGYKNYDDFSNDMKKDNDVASTVALSNTYLTKIRNDYETLIPAFQINKEIMNSEKIIEWIGAIAS